MSIRPWREKRLLATAGVAAAAAVRLMPRRGWLMTIACMSDKDGREIERHFEETASEFQERGLAVCLGYEYGAANRNGATRTWEDWRARRLAVILLVLAYLCQPSKWHGSVAWMVRGFALGVFSVACQKWTLVGGARVTVRPHRNTLNEDLRLLQAAGLVERFQPPAYKVADWLKGLARMNSKGEAEQWAFNMYFLMVCPWPPGQSRITPHGAYTVPRDGLRVTLDSQMNIDATRARKQAERLPDGLHAAQLDQLVDNIEREAANAKVPALDVDEPDQGATVYSLEEPHPSYAHLVDKWRALAPPDEPDS